MRHDQFLVYAQDQCAPIREAAYDQVVAFARSNGLEDPTALGKCHGSHPETSEWNAVESQHSTAAEVDNKKRFRFILTMENHMTKGRLSEKLFNAHLAGSVAIYRGHPAHSEIVNPKSYIQYDINNVTGALARILELETDHDQYERTLNEPFLADGKAHVRTQAKSFV